MSITIFATPPLFCPFVINPKIQKGEKVGGVTLFTILSIVILSMLNLAILLTGYSIFYAISLSLTHFYCENYKDQRLAQVMGLVLITALAGLQLSHFFYLLDTYHLQRLHDSLAPTEPSQVLSTLQYSGLVFIHSPYYLLLLFVVAPAFYLFSKPLLTANNHFHPMQLMHFSPVILAFLLPYAMAMQLAFIIGGLYLVWLAIRLYALRHQRQYFSLELFILGTAFVVALLALVLGLFLPILSEEVFYILYASAIGLAFMMINLVLNYAPKLTTQVVDAARETYAISTLSNIDCDRALQSLKKLMQDRKLYQENTLDLYTVATELDLNNHQLSELINTHLGKSFSRYIREYRVEAAKDLLLSDPKLSILSVGLSVGFTSQSNFYEAFREITGSTPGKYRKLKLS